MVHVLWAKDFLQRQRNKLQGYSIEMDSIIENDGVTSEKNASTHHKAFPVGEDIPLNITKINAEKGWTPFWLRKGVLIAFIILFIAIFAALQVLYSISQRNHGLATSNDNYHYLWTYGPTAGIAPRIATTSNNH